MEGNFTLRCQKLKRIFLIFTCVLMSLIIPHCAQDKISSLNPVVYSPPPLTETTWELIADPDSAGWSSEKLRNAFSYSKTISTAAVMIIFRDQVLYYWGNIDQKYWTHSCRKSFMSALYGIHVEEENIDLDKTMEELGIDDKNPSLSDQEKQATVRMLLQARSGVYHEAAAESASMKAARPARHSHLPGSFWYYNNWDFNALYTIFEQETGKLFFEELKARIFDPIGTEDFEVSDGSVNFEDVSIHPSYLFRITAMDMARFGLLFLNNGKWKGNQIISKEWIEDSTHPWSQTGYDPFWAGYGYMWWITSNSPVVPNGSYYAAGYGGHYILVIPAMDIVIVHRVDTDNNHSVSSEDFIHLVELILDARL